MSAYRPGQPSVRPLRLLTTLAAALLMAHVAPAASQQPSPPATRPAGGEKTFAIAIHGGAGTIRRQDMRPELEKQYRETLEQSLRAGHAVLARGGTAMDAVEAAILVMEDSPLFNAGKGAVFTSAGTCELDASIMDGRDMSAGAVAAVTTIKNPIRAARAVMERSPHVMLAGDGAETFARDVGLETVANDYFQTERRRRALEEAQRREREQRSSAAERHEAERRAFQVPEIEGKFGTVGCVALDQHGNLAAGTSTGGITNKRFGRVGDTPIIGAGNYAENATAAVSCTGQGEFFMRLMVASDLAARMRYAGQGIDDASAAQMGRLSAMKAQGGLIALDQSGRVVFAFNTEGMYRASMGPVGAPQVAIYGEAVDRLPNDLPGNGGADWDSAVVQPKR